MPTFGSGNPDAAGGPKNLVVRKTTCRSWVVSPPFPQVTQGLHCCFSYRRFWYPCFWHPPSPPSPDRLIRPTGSRTASRPATTAPGCAPGAPIHGTAPQNACDFMPPAAKGARHLGKPRKGFPPLHPIDAVIAWARATPVQREPASIA
jgi:hypothetical protein